MKEKEEAAKDGSWRKPNHYGEKNRGGQLRRGWKSNGSTRPQRQSGGGRPMRCSVGSNVTMHEGLRWHWWHGKEKLMARWCTQPVSQEGMLSGGEAGRGSASLYFEKCGWARRKKIARGVKVGGVTPNPHLQTASSQELLMHILNCKRVLSSGHAVCSFRMCMSSLRPTIRLTKEASALFLITFSTWSLRSEVV